MGTIDERIQVFKDELSTNTIESIIDKHITFGVPFVFQGNEGKHYNLIKKISDYFEVEQRNIFIVGSAKLGFSISPTKLWNHIDWNEEEDSDIDVVIISDRIFDAYWKDILEYNSSIRIMKKDKNYIDFLDYFFSGWLRPDKFPYNYAKKDEWFEFFKEISYKDDFGGRKIAVAIYREDYFFRKYHFQNLKVIQAQLSLEK